MIMMMIIIIRRIIIKVKVKWSRYRPGVAQRVGRGIALLFHDRGTRRGWVVNSTPRSYFTHGKEPVPILQEARWAPGPVWTGEILVPTGIRSRTVQPVVSHYTDWATRPTVIIIIIIIIIIITCNVWEKLWICWLWSLIAFKCSSVRNSSHILYRWTADLIFVHPWIHSLRLKVTNKFNSKELGVLILTVEHNYITIFASIITRRVTTTTCFGPICGPSSGCD